jgi:pimeloyl-ACP methyl ester carboxylesterase
MTTFALIHGGFHGAWCWQPLETELRRMGFATIAVDLPISDPAAGNVCYAEAVVNGLSTVGDDVVVVGHSQGGLTAPLVADRRRIRKMVFLTAAVPTPGRPFTDYLVEHPAFLRLPADLPTDDVGRLRMPADVARSAFFHDCPDDVVAWAVAQLRPQSMVPWAEPCPLNEWPSVPGSYIVARDDRAVDPEGCRSLASHHNLDVVEIDGSHSPFLARPAELAKVLTKVGLA